MAAIQISNLYPTESDLLFYVELSPEEAAQIQGEGLFGGIIGAVAGGVFGGVVGFGAGVTFGGPVAVVPPGYIGGALGAGTGGYIGYKLGYRFIPF